MTLTVKDVEHVAHLARIEVTETEAERYLAQLSEIFNLIEEMQSVDTTGITPMSHALDVTLRLRDDEVTETDQRELYQSIAPKVMAGLYIVPKVIE